LLMWESIRKSRKKQMERRQQDCMLLILNCGGVAQAARATVS
jgi:hypothetical protein